MKTLLPLLKTKLVLLSFVFASTFIIAATVTISIKSRTENIEIKKHGDNSKAAKKSFQKKLARTAAAVTEEATVVTDKTDYQPGDLVEITGSGWTAGETVSLNILSDCGCVDTTMFTTADASGNIYDKTFLITADHIGAEFVLTATGQVSEFVAVTTFTDAGAVELLVMPSNVATSSNNQSYTLALRVNTNTNLGSAWIEHETDWSDIQLGTVKASGSKPWSATYNSGTRRITLTGAANTDRLSNVGETVLITITADASASSGEKPWKAQGHPNANLGGSAVAILDQKVNIGNNSRDASATINPSSVSPGSSTPFLLTFTKTDATGDQLGTVAFHVPFDYTITAVSAVTASAGKSWTAVHDAGTGLVRLQANSDGNRLTTNGQSVSVTVTATAPGSAGGPQAWKTGIWKGWQADDSPYEIASQPSTTVSSACSSPTITLSAIPSVCKGTTSVGLEYTATTNSPNEYKIDFDPLAEAQLFADVPYTTLPASPISITVPANAVAGSYNGVLKVRSSVSCESINYNITVTVNPVPVTTGATLCPGGSGQLTVTSSCLPTTGLSSLKYALSGSSGGGNGNPWTFPGNINADDGTATTNSLNTGANISSEDLITSNFGFNIPANATIDGIYAEINRWSSDNAISLIDNQVQLTKDGGTTPVGDDKKLAGTWSDNNTTVVTYGGAADKWNTTWTPAEINNSNFGLILDVNNNGSGTRTASVDYIRITVYYSLNVGAEIRWYTVSSGGTPVEVGTNPFNPVGDAQVISAGGTYANLTNTNTPGTYTFWAECSIYEGCRTATNFVINALPTMTCPSTVAVCEGSGSFALTGGSPIGGTYSGTGVSAGNFNPLTAGVGEHTVTYTYTDGNSCSNTCSFTVSVRALPLDKTFGAENSTVCSGSGTNIQVLSSDVSTVYRLHNSADNSLVTSASGNGGTLNLPTGNLTASTTYYVVAVKNYASPVSMCTRQLTGTATVTVVAQPVGPTLNVRSPINTTICTGQTVSATFNAGSGGVGCEDDFVVSIDGGGDVAYTPGSSVGGSATSSIVIKGRRANCDAGAGCNGTSYATLASWTVVPQPVGPTLLAKTPDVASVCFGTSVSATFNPGTDGAGCADDYILIIDGGAPVAYTPGSSVGSTATTSIVIRGRRASCDDGSGCNGTSYTTLASWSVNALPNSTSFTGNTICVGQNGQLTFDAINATFVMPYTIEYKETSGSTVWSQVISSASATSFNVAVNPTTTTNYTLVSITNGNGCVRTTGFTDGTAQITVNPLPTIALGSNPAVCQGATSANLPYSGTTNGANQYSIDYDVTAEGQTFVDVSNAALAVAPNNITLVVPAAAAPGTYNGVLTVRNSSTTCISITYNISVTIDGNPTVTTGNACKNGSTVTFTQTGGTLGGTWSVSGGGTIDPSTGIFTPTTTGCFTATYTTPNAGCFDTRSFVVFPEAPSAPVVNNTCNIELTIPALNVISGFTAQYSFDNGGNWSTSNVSPVTTPGCYSMKTRYVLTNACGSNIAGTTAPAACEESTTGFAVIFPIKPTVAPIMNTCNTKLADITAVTPVAGFTAEYAVKAPGGDFSSFGTIAAANALLTNTAGCWAVKARYKLTNACGSTNAGATRSGACGESTDVNAVVFPAPPLITAPSNTCNAAFSLPTVTPVPGFGVEYNINFTGWSATPIVPTAPGCYTIHARYVLSLACGSTAAGSDGPLPPCPDEDCPVIGGCTVSLPVYVVIFPAAPSAPVVSNTCNAALTIPALNPVTGFTAQYSFDNGNNWSTSNVSASTTPGCYSMKTRYVTNQCGTIAANTPAPAACAASATGNAVIFPAAPIITATANTCNAMFTLPTVTPQAGFDVVYSIDNGAYAANPSTTTPGCHTVKAKYVLDGTCGGTADGASAPAGCLESNTVSVVIFPAAPIITATANTCNAMFTLPTVTPQAGFDVVYSIDNGAYAAYPSTTTPGCHTVKAKYVLDGPCGGTADGADAPAGCLESNTVSVVIFPAAPIITAPANTCNAMFTLPTVTPRAGFHILYSIDGNTYAANPSTTASGCHTVKAKYVLASDCGNTDAGANAPAGCLESNTVSVVIFPAAPIITAPANTCNAMFTLPNVTPQTGFDVVYSLDNGAYAAYPSTTTPGCHTVKAKYVLDGTCGGTADGASAPAGCLESNTVSVVIFPTAPVITAPANTCNAAFTLPNVTPVSGFNIKYSIDGGAWSASPSTTAVGCHSIKAKYVLAASCGSTAAYSEGTGLCGESNEVNVVIFPLAPPAPTVNPACNEDIVVTAPSSVTGFTIQYSFTDGATWTVNSPPTADNCSGYKIRTRYVTETTCGAIPAGTIAPAACAMSPATTRILDKTAPVISCKTNTTRSTGAGLCTYKVSGYEFDLASASDNCTASGSLIKAWCVTNPNASTQNGTGSLGNTDLYFGLNTIKWTATDGCGNTSTCSFTVNVNQVTTTTTVTVSPTSQQYSDNVTFTATVTPFNCTGAGSIGGQVKFKIGTMVIGTAPIASDGTATLTTALLEDQLYDANVNDPMNATSGPLDPQNNPKTVTACFENIDEDYVAPNATTPLTVECEDADITYNGQTYFTVNPNNLSGTVVLSNSIIDKDDGATTRGDIRNATGTFWQNSVGGTVLGTANTPVGLVNPGNLQEGILTTSFNTTLSSSEASGGGRVYQVYSGLDNYYCDNNTGGDYTTVTLAMPGQDFVTGGGHLIFGNNSAGTYAGTPGKRMNFGFVMKWNSSGKNLQGQVNVIFRKVVNGVTRLYQIKSNAINSLVVENVNNSGGAATGANITFRRATISTKANLKDITDPSNEISLGGNLSLTLIGWESTTVNTGALDRISVQLVGAGSIGLLFSSNWSGGNSLWQTINGGKIQVRNSATPPPGQQTNITRTGEVDKSAEVAPFNVKAYPNPTEHQFTLYLEGGSNEKVSIVVYDAIGRQVKKIERGDATGAIKFGEDLKVGAYIVEVRQGNNRKTIKLVKQ